LNILWKTGIACLVLMLFTMFCAASDPSVPAQKASHKMLCDMVVNAINAQNWNFLRKITTEEMTGASYIGNWEKHPVRIGKLIKVENDIQWKGVTCTPYSFAMEYADGKPHPHWLQILIHEDGDRLTIQNFWEFGW